MKILNQLSLNEWKHDLASIAALAGLMAVVTLIRLSILL